MITGCGIFAILAAEECSDSIKTPCRITITVVTLALAAILIGLANGLAPKLYEEGKISLTGFKVFFYLGAVEAGILTLIVLAGLKCACSGCN